MQKLLQQDIKTKNLRSNIIQPIKELLCQMFFTDIFVEEDVLSTAPFYGKLPFPTPSGRDSIWDTFFILYFSCLSENNNIYFYAKLSSSSISLLRDCSTKKDCLMLDFLDSSCCDHTSDENCVSCLWNVSLLFDGQVFGTKNGPERTEEDNLWHCSFALNSPLSSTDGWEENVPKEGVFVVFHGCNLPSNPWVALGAVTLYD